MVEEREGRGGGAQRIFRAGDTGVRKEPPDFRGGGRFHVAGIDTPANQTGLTGPLRQGSGSVSQICQPCDL